MTAAPRSKKPSSIGQAVLGGGAMTAALLCLQGAAPISGDPSAPAWLNWGAASWTTIMLLWFVSFGKKDEQALGVFVLLVTGYSVALSRPWEAVTPDELASSLAQTLSTTWNGIALLALLQAWAILGLGLLCGRSALRLSDDHEAFGVRVSAWLIAGAVAVFGVRGLIGYASGNLSLLIT